MATNPPKPTGTSKAGSVRSKTTKPAAVKPTTMLPDPLGGSAHSRVAVPLAQDSASRTDIEVAQNIPRTDQPGKVFVTIDRPVPTSLAPDQRVLELMLSYNATAVRNYQYAGFHPDALIAAKGYDELDKMRTLAPYEAALGVAMQAIFYKGWRWKAPQEIVQGTPEHEMAVRLCDELTWHTENIVDEGDQHQTFRDVLRNVAMAVHHGFSLQEMNWRVVEKGPKSPTMDVSGQWGFSNFSYKICKQVGFELDPITLSLKNVLNWPLTSGTPQRDIPVEKVLLYTFQCENGLPHGRGVARACYKHYVVLDFLYKVWTLALEMHGIPHYRASAPLADQATSDALRAALDKVRTGSSLVYPDGITVDLDQLQGAGLTAFLNCIQHHTEMIALNVLFQQLTTHQGTGQGSYALGAIHQATQEYRLKSIREDIMEAVTHAISRRWVRYNYGEEYVWLAPQLDLGDWDAHDRLLLGQSFTQMLQTNVLDPQEQWIRDMMGYPVPDMEAAARIEDRQKALLEGMKAAAGKPPTTTKDTNQDTPGEDNTQFGQPRRVIYEPPRFRAV